MSKIEMTDADYADLDRSDIEWPVDDTVPADDPALDDVWGGDDA